MSTTISNTNDHGALQHPIGSGFGAASTAEEVIRGIDLTGKTAIVTGGYSGIGRETVKALLSVGAEVIVPARSLDKARTQLAELSQAIIEPLDLQDPASIDAFAEKFLATGKPLHLLINNAGIMATPLVRDGRGYESQFATNHLGHFQLTARLWPALVRAAGARVVNVSSWGHHFSPVDLDDPNYSSREYDPWGAYGQAKTANILFSLELDHRGKAAGVRAYSLHPGAIADTDLARHLPDGALAAAGLLDANGEIIIDPARGLKTTPQGASTTVWCATSPQLADLGGVYCENTEVAVLDSTWQPKAEMPPVDEMPEGVTPYALDPEAARGLWSLSEELTGVTFDV